MVPGLSTFTKPPLDPIQVLILALTSDYTNTHRSFIMSNALYCALADVVLVSHVVFVAFVVIGLPLILLGGWLQWSWVRNRCFRFCHLAAIGIVVIQAWLGIVCPLTSLEMHLRELGGDTTYQGTFIAHWLQKILFIEAPLWAFTACYSLFAFAVIASWLWVRPSERPR